MSKIQLQTTMNDLIGNTDHIECKTTAVFNRGLTIRIFEYKIKNITSFNQKSPIIVIHGGPSFCHNYLLPLQLLCNYGHTVIFYDQAGCGQSSRISEPELRAPWLLTIEYYLEELSLIIESCGISTYYLYGSSWGTIIAQEFAVKKPSNLLGIILDGALCDAQLYGRTQQRDRISTLPSYTQKLLKNMTDNKDFDNPIYEQIETFLGSCFTCRLIPRPTCFYDSISGFNKEIYVKMQGVNEFCIGGVLEFWKITDRLVEVEVPALVLMGEYDTMTEECSMEVVKNIRNCFPLVTIPRAAHCKTLDEPQLCVEEVLKFIENVEKRIV